MSADLFRRLLSASLLSSALLLLFAGCGDGAAESFAPNAFAGGAGRDGNFPDITVPSFTNFTELTYDSLPTGFLGPPLFTSSSTSGVVTADRRLALVRSQRIYATYQFEEGLYPMSELASDAEGRLFAVTTSSLLHAIDPDGNLLWKVDAGGDDISLPTWPLVLPEAPSGELIVAGSTRGIVKGITADGAITWEVDFGGKILRSIAWSEDVGIVIGRTSNDYGVRDTIITLDAEGKVLNKTEMTGRIEYGPLISDGRIVVGLASLGSDQNYISTLVTLDRNGKVISESKLRVLPLAIAADTEGNLYVSGGGGSRMVGGEIASYDRQGKLRWQIGLRQSAPTHLLVSSSRVHFLAFQGESVGLWSYTSDGQPLKFAPIETLARVAVPPTITPGGLLVISCSNQPILLRSNN